MLKLTPKQKKQWIEAPLAFYKEMIDPHTHWLHLCLEDPTSRSTIPVFENFLYLVGRLRDHHLEALEEVTHKILDLFSFQNDDGAFPAYFHLRGYGSHHTSLMMTLPFAITLRHYINLFSKEGSERIEKVMRALLAYLSKQTFSSEIDQFSLKMARHLLLGEEIPESIWKKEQFRSFPELIQYLLFLQMEDLSTCPAKRSHFEQIMSLYFYHDVYVGPLWEEKTVNGWLPEILFTENSSKASLLTTLFLPTTSFTSSPSLAATTRWKEICWDLFHKEGVITHLISSLDKEEAYPSQMQLLRMVFPLRESLSLFQQSSDFRASYSKDNLELFFRFNGVEKEGEEITFYLTKSEESHFEIEGIPATTFTLGEKVSFTLQGNKVDLVAQVLHGKADVLGMISRGSRPSNEKKGKNGSDWMISIRPGYRTEILDMSITITLQSKLGLENLRQVPSHEDHCPHKERHQ